MHLHSTAAWSSPGASATAFFCPTSRLGFLLALRRRSRLLLLHHISMGSDGGMAGTCCRDAPPPPPRRRLLPGMLTRCTLRGPGC